ncbi:MAG: hypothetical protein OXL96_05665 [Candidatus Poribacteria bacterium]|nr:hypothetical protein [Candidatus Poribacteria bacterium]
MSIPKLSTKEAQTLFAAHVFVFTSRDGMVISKIINVSPYKLHKLSRSEKWIEALKFWGYTGDPTLKGKRYKKKVAIKQVSESLKKADTLWRELFGVKPISQKLRRFLGE